MVDDVCRHLNVGVAIICQYRMAAVGVASTAREIAAVHVDLEAVAGACDHLVVLRAGRVALDERQDAPFSLAELRRKYDQSAEPRT